jgi:LacI family transcriptional regulator
VFEHFVRRRVDAVITTATRSGDRALIEDIARRVPTVLAVRPLAGSGLTTLTGDDRAGAGLVVRHFAGLGHRRVAQLVGPRDVANFALRGDGFTASAQRAGLRVLEIPEAAGAATWPRGAGDDLAAAAPPPPPDRGVRTQRHDGVRCPGRSAHLWRGVPGRPLAGRLRDAPAAALTSPALTTVRIPGYELGCRAAEAAVSLLASPSSSPVRVSLRPVLVHRGSSAAPPRHLDGVWR